MTGKGIFEYKMAKSGKNMLSPKTWSTKFCRSQSYIKGVQYFYIMSNIFETTKRGKLNLRIIVTY